MAFPQRILVAEFRVGPLNALVLENDGLDGAWTSRRCCRGLAQFRDYRIAHLDSKKAFRSFRVAAYFDDYLGKHATDMDGMIKGRGCPIEILLNLEGRLQRLI